ncbi:hypothetical protein ACROYT_G032687 [Oculina patagonica]
MHTRIRFAAYKEYGLLTHNGFVVFLSHQKRCVGPIIIAANMKTAICMFIVALLIISVTSRPHAGPEHEILRSVKIPYEADKPWPATMKGQRKQFRRMFCDDHCVEDCIIELDLGMLDCEWECGCA